MGKIQIGQFLITDEPAGASRLVSSEACLFISHQFLEMKSKMLSTTSVLTLRDTKGQRNRLAVRRHWLRKILSRTSRQVPASRERSARVHREGRPHQAGCQNRTAETGAIKASSAHSQFRKLSPRVRQTLCLVRATPTSRA